MEVTSITLKVKKGGIKSMEIDTGNIKGANSIVNALASVANIDGSASAKVADVVREIIEFEKLAAKTAKKVYRLDKQIAKDIKREKRKLAKLEMIQLKLEEIKQSRLAKMKKREKLCDIVRNSGYYARKGQ